MIMDWKQIEERDLFSGRLLSTPYAKWSQRNPTFFKEFSRYVPLEYWYSPTYGVLPLFNNEGLYNSIGDIASYPVIHFPMLKPVEAIKSFSQIKSIGLYGIDYLFTDQFKPEEISTSDAVHFMLPKTFGEYLQSLGKQTRKQYRNIYEKNSDLTVKYAVNAKEIDTAIVWFCDRWKNRPADEVDPNYINWWINHAYMIEALVKLNLATCFCLYKDDKLVAVNVAEAHAGRMFDIFSARDPEVDLQRELGKFCVLYNIEYAIRMGMTWYELGIEFDYKLRFMPKGEQCRKLANYLSLVGPLADTFDDFEEPFYKNNVLIPVPADGN